MSHARTPRGFGEAAGIAQSGDQGCRVQNANAGDGRETLRGRIIARQAEDLAIQTLNLGIEFAPLGTQMVDEMAQSK